MSRRLLVSFLSALALAMLFASSASSQSVATYTFGTLPGTPTPGQLAWITDNSGTPTEGSPAAGGAAPGNRDLVAYDATQTRWEFVVRVPASAPAADLETYIDAVRVGYDNSESGATAEDVQAALDELFDGGVAGSDDQTATEVPFTSTISGWVSANVRAALDYLLGLIGPDMACRTGFIRGGGYDPVTLDYAWTCGNYAWTAEIGGIDVNSVSAYSTPTTVGGNSWVMNCTGLGTGSPGTATEQTACLAANTKVRMYSTGDLVLAHDQTRPGGTIYLPEGIYHHAYCGKSSAGVPNGCPVTREQPGVQIRKFVQTKARKVVGAGRDLDGPFTQGRTGTYLVSDHGSDNDADGSWVDDTPDWLAITGGPSASPWIGGHWAWHAGPKDTREVCGRTLGSTGCITNTSVSGWQTDGQLAMSPANIGYVGGSIAADFTAHDFSASAYPELCIHDTIGAAGRGVCSGDQRVQCTTNDGTRPTANSGGCSALGLGTCIGQYEALRQASLALPDDDYMTLAVSTQGLGAYGSANGFSGTSQSFFLPVAKDGFVGTSCASGTGKLVRIGGPASREFKYGIGNMMALTATNSSMTAYNVPYSRLAMHGAGMSHLSIMPKDYFRGPNCADGSQAGCDELEVINFSNGFGAHHHDLASWYNSGNAGGHFGFSVVDGDPRCMSCRLTDTLVSDFYGLASDASGWEFEDVVWQNGRTTSGGDVRAVIATAFGPESRFTRMKFRNMYTDALFAFQNSSGAIIRDTIVNDVEFAISMVRLRGAVNLTIDGLTGFATAGPLIAAEGGTAASQTPSQIHISNVHLKNHHWNNTLRPKALLSRTSYGGTVGFDGRYYGSFTLRDSSLQVHGDDSACLFFFDGQRGLDTTADEGLGFPTDDDRNVFHFENVDLEVYNDGSPTGTQQAFCFGDHGTAGALFPGGAGLYDLHQIVGAVPSWRDISVGGVPIPDNVYSSMTSEQAGDCGAKLYGVVARIHDADVVGECEDSDANGVMDPESVDDVGLTALCRCNPAGNSGTGAWEPF